MPHQSGSHDGAVGVDDPSTRRTGRALRRVGVADLLAAVEHRRPQSDPGLGQPRRPQAGFADRSTDGGHLDLTVEAQAADRLEVDTRRAFHHRVATPIDLGQRIQWRLIGTRVEAATVSGPAGGVEQNHRTSADRVQGVGTAQWHTRTEVVACHRQSHLVDIAAQDQISGVGQRGQLGTDRAGGVMDDGAGQPLGAMPGHRGGGGLLEGLVGEQPFCDVDAGELGYCFAAQQCCLDQCGGVLTVCPADSGDVGDAARVGQGEAGHLGERSRTLVAGQIVDIGSGERQDGLTPVIITL